MFRLTLSLILVVLISIVGLGWGLDQLFNRYSRTDVESDYLSAYLEIGNQLAGSLDKFKYSEELILQWQDNHKISASINSSDAYPLPPELKDIFIQGEPLTLESEGDISLLFYMPTKKQVLVLTLTNIEPTSAKPTLNLVYTLIFYIGIIGLILLWLYPLVKRLLALRATAKAFGEGDLRKRVNKGSVSYISDIENEFNRMAQRIETLVNDNKLLGSAVSHDLRTPLARLRFGIEALSETKDPEIRKKYEAHISDDIEEMESLVEILLQYARLDQAMIEVNKKPVDLSQLLSECAHSAETEEKEITLNNAQKNCLIMGDKRYLTILINNLLQNAIQYSKRRIIISLNQKNGKCYIAFEDDGPGIETTQRDQVLKPFIRGDIIHPYKGYGMGLAIVVRIAEWHSGTIEITDSVSLGGASIQIQVPTHN